MHLFVNLIQNIDQFPGSHDGVVSIEDIPVCFLCSSVPGSGIFEQLNDPAKPFMAAGCQEPVLSRADGIREGFRGAGYRGHLYETCFDVRYLETAIRLGERELELFEDTAEAGFYSTAAGDRNLVMRLKDDYDGAEPSGNSMAVLGLLRLAEHTNRDDFRAAADRALRSFGAKLAQAPVTAPQMLVAAMYAESEPKQIVVAGEMEAGARELLRAVWSRFLPAKTLALADGKSAKRLASLAPAVAERVPVDGKAAAYVCENYACHLPVTDKQDLIKLLQ